MQDIIMELCNALDTASVMLADGERDQNIEDYFNALRERAQAFFPWEEYEKRYLSAENKDPWDTAS